MSKFKKSRLSIVEQEKLIRSLIVDKTEHSYHLKKGSDDGGNYLMIYLPECAREDFDINGFREDRYKLVGFSRVLIAFVGEDYVTDLNK